MDLVGLSGLCLTFDASARTFLPLKHSRAGSIFVVLGQQRGKGLLEGQLVQLWHHATSRKTLCEVTRSSRLDEILNAEWRTGRLSALPTE